MGIAPAAAPGASRLEGDEAGGHLPLDERIAALRREHAVQLETVNRLHSGELERQKATGVFFIRTKGAKEVSDQKPEEDLSYSILPARAMEGLQVLLNQLYLPMLEAEFVGRSGYPDDRVGGSLGPRPMDGETFGFGQRRE